MTDIYTIVTYYRSDELAWKASALLFMVLLNLFIQELLVYGANNKTSWSFMIKEAMITLFLFRPAVDVYRACTNHGIEKATVEVLDLLVRSERAIRAGEERKWGG